MSLTTQDQKSEHSPTLNTIMMVEAVLKSADSVLTIAEIKKRLPRQVNHTVLKTILEYLEQSNKIAVSLKGITWAYNPDPRMKEALRKSHPYPETVPR